MKYVIVIEKADDGSFSACVPDLPGCVACGETAEEARALIQEGVALQIDSLRRHGEPMPPPATQGHLVEAA